MAGDTKHTIRIVDKDGNQSEVTLPGFAMDSTQEKLIKSVQALGKLNPKTVKAYEDLIKETKNTVTATEDASDQQKKDAKALQNTVQNVGDKQISALRQFRTNFADRIGKDMRDTFTAGGNILTAAIKTATVGLAAGAGLLYKTFMDTSEAFRSLAQQGLGTAGASGTEAQDAVADLTRLGMSASEAAGFLTSFGQASAILGKANFSKFVSGIAGASSFAADLGLTLEEAAEFTAEEIEIRQRGLNSDLQLNSFNRQAIEESIQQTQRFAGVMGRSMKDINASKKTFFEDNTNINALMMRLSKSQAERLNAQINTMMGGAAALGGDYEKLMGGLVNAAANQTPILDSGLQQVANFGSAAGDLYQNTLDLSAAMQAGDMGSARVALDRFNKSLLALDAGDLQVLEQRAQAGDAMAGMIINARRAVQVGGAKLEESFKKAAAANDPMVTAAARVQSAFDRISGTFTTFRNQLLGRFAEPLNTVLDQFNLTGDQLEEYNKQRIKAIQEDKNLTEEQKKQRIKALATKSIFDTLNDGLTKIGNTIMNKFFPNIDLAADGAGAFVDMIVTKVDEFLTEVNDFIDNLEGDTNSEKIIDAISKGLGILFEKGVDIVWATLKNIVKNHWDSLFKAIGILMIAALAKAGIGALISTVFSRKSATAAASSAATIKSAGNALALAIRQVAMAVRRAGAGLGVGGPMGAPGGGTGGGRRGRRGMRLDRLAGKASLVGIGTSLVGGIASDALHEAGHEKTASAVDTVANVAGMAGTGAMIGSLFAPGIGTAIGAAVGGAAGIGMSLYQNWDTWFGSDEAQEAMAERGQEAIESIDETGMAAMAMDPDHIKAVSAALNDLNSKTSVDKIAKGLTEFNPTLEQMFAVIQNIRVAFVDNVNNRLQRLLDILTGLNEQGLNLPTTIENLGSLADKITAMPITKIERLATAFTALTEALTSFGDLTTSTTFGRMWDAFTGKRDETEDVIKILNNFADKVDSEKLLKAAQATMAFNAGMSGYAAVPAEPTRTSPTGNDSPAQQVNNASNMNYSNPTMKFDAMIDQLAAIKQHMENSNTHVSAIRRRVVDEPNRT